MTVTDALNTLRNSPCATRHIFSHIATTIPGTRNPTSYMPTERAHYTAFIELPHRSHTNNHSIQLGRYHQHTTLITYINNATVHPSAHTPKSQQLHRLPLPLNFIITISTLRRPRSRRNQSSIRVRNFPPTGTPPITIRQRQSVQCGCRRNEARQY